MPELLTREPQQTSAFRALISDQLAATYCHRRFEGSRRMHKLNRCEMGFARRLMDMVGPQASILDAPCGSGRFFEVFSPARRYVMLDFDPAMLKVIQDTHGQKCLLELVQGDVTDLPFPADTFDLVFNMRLLQHVGDDAIRRRILMELARVSRRYVALSIYSTCTWRHFKRAVRGKPSAGYAVPLRHFVAMAAQIGLRLRRKAPTVSLIEQQRMLLFEKVTAARGPDSKE